MKHVGNLAAVDVQRGDAVEGVVPNMNRIGRMARENADNFGLARPPHDDVCAMLRMAFDPEGEYLRYIREDNLPNAFADGMVSRAEAAA